MNSRQPRLAIRPLAGCVVLAGVMLPPVLHHVLHRFHLDQRANGSGA